MLWRTNGLAEMGRNWGTLGEGGWATLDSFEKMRTCYALIWWFNGDLTGTQWWFNGDLMVIRLDLMGFNGDLTG